MGIFMIIFLIIVILLVVWFFRGSFNNILKNRKSEQHDPLDILNSRLASGEISEQEYERLKKKISKGV